MDIERRIESLAQSVAETKELLLLIDERLTQQEDLIDLHNIVLYGSDKLGIDGGLLSSIKRLEESTRELAELSRSYRIMRASFSRLNESVRANTEVLAQQQTRLDTAQVRAAAVEEDRAQLLQTIKVWASVGGIILGLLQLVNLLVEVSKVLNP